MPSPFAFATVILFGRCQSQTASARVAALKRRVLLVHGRDPARSAALAQGLRDAGCTVTGLAVLHEPDLAGIEAALAVASGTEVVVAMGGSAVTDAGKAIAALVPATRPCPSRPFPPRRTPGPRSPATR